MKRSFVKATNCPNTGALQTATCTLAARNGHGKVVEAFPNGKNNATFSRLRIDRITTVSVEGSEAAHAFDPKLNPKPAAHHTTHVLTMDLLGGPGEELAGLGTRKTLTLSHKTP